MVSGGAFYPPKDYRKWEALIEAWARHSGERYGVDRASSWLWELWNEPESPYWRGTKEEYFRLYDHFAAAVKRALPNARVGGPHVTDPGWKNGDVFMRAFLEHCRSGRNAATGGVGAPLDFVAFHAKGTTRLDEKGRVEMNLRNHLKTIDTYGRIIASFPRFARLPIYIGESDPEGCAGCPATLDPERDYRRTSQFAAYTAASFMRKQDLLARTGGNLQGAVSWAFTFSDQPWFNGLRALTTNEVALPVFNTFELFATARPQRLAVDAPAMIPVDAIIADSVRGEPDLGVVASIDDARVAPHHPGCGTTMMLPAATKTVATCSSRSLVCRAAATARAPSNTASTKCPAMRIRHGWPWARRSRPRQSRWRSCTRPPGCARSRVILPVIAPAICSSTSPCLANP